MASLEDQTQSLYGNNPQQGMMDEDAGFKMLLMKKIQTTHRQMPGVKKVPLSAIGIIVLVAAINILVWICMGIILVREKAEL